jgi:hypothetical protein
MGGKRSVPRPARPEAIRTMAKGLTMGIEIATDMKKG